MSIHVLIVEDDPFYSNIYKTKFDKENIPAAVVSSGKDAFEKLTTEKPRVILLDLVLPEEDGFEILEKIKKDQKVADIPVVILSNLSDPIDFKRTQQLGAKEYLVKANVTLQEVVNKVQKYIADNEAVSVETNTQ
jgi:DNA-binding response OmpR family regulator